MTVNSSNLQKKLSRGEFVVTVEVCPPKGCDTRLFLQQSKELSGIVDAINVTDNQGANMRISPLAASLLLQREGLEPIMQLTCRDRNRLALQSELLGAAALGIKNILALSGDHISFGDHKEAKAVFDLDSVQLLEAIKCLESGSDLSGKSLDGIPSFFIGAAAAPEAEPFELTLFKLRKKAAVGAQFFQTQAVFNPAKLARFYDSVKPLGVKIISGILLLKSAGMARFINKNIPGLRVPDEFIAELENSANPAFTGVEIACRLARAVKPWSDGVHIMAMGREEVIPEIVSAVK
ncbi:MAG: 5,10-methylenetetrahydrofolate reductase [Deltaproteobacteria bacterium HGW-Deltaproteobacteria-23]|nr:MAG: 5,10-methylenetetrahydrofolate reductase [Deltaproteobacteria bacterium HGW-Deltaproteobacteria-23]